MKRLELKRLALIGLLCLPSGVRVDAAQRPNIVVILADDMGYGDVQALNRNSTIATPNLNRLADEGMTFLDAHSPSAVCTPTRYGLLTGRYCWRTRLKRRVLNGYGTPLMKPDRTTVAAMLHQQGYYTGIVGKWHLGLGIARAEDGEGFDYSKPVELAPNAFGFDEFFIIPASLDFPPYVYIKDGRIIELPTEVQPAQKFPAYLRAGPIQPNFNMEECLDHLTDVAASFIRDRANQEKPFFLYFPLTAPHKPVLPHSRFRGKSDLGPYGDFVMQVDWTVGQVLNALDEVGVEKNTLVIYTSDNGSFMYRRDDPAEEGHVKDETIQAYRAEDHTANHHFRGTKADVWEAGHRVPFFARWPERAEAGSRCTKTISLTDVFATCAEIAGGILADHWAEDSFSLLPLMQGGDWASQRAPVIHHSAAGMFSIRHKRWKLVLGNGSGGREVPRGKPFEKPYHLFDLNDDIREQRNLIDEQPEIAATLEKEFQKIHDSGRSR